MRLLDGPARGWSGMVRRAPVFLRVVIDPDGKIDVLDQLDDEPKRNENVLVYRKVVGTGGHVCVRHGHGRGCYEMGDYRHLEDVDGEQLRDAGPWRAWVELWAEQEAIAFSEAREAAQESD